MVARQSLCDDNRLQDLLHDRLPAAQQVVLESHLEQCSPCRQKLEHLAADEAMWRETTDVLSSHDGCSSCGAAREAGLFDLKLLEHVLTESDNPDHLGLLDGYAVTAIAGQGGMGIVVRAEDRELDRTVAIKILAPHLASSGAARQRFAREAQAAAAVVHPHVIPIYVVNPSAPLPYLVMQFVAESLQQRIDREGSLDIKDMLRIGLQTARGLAAAHEQGMVHRDVKPSNILLENGGQRVLLSDFGLARAADDASLTRSGVIAGTPQYMSPEQATGKVVDHRADLFALGSVLYTMATGHAPFRAESSMAVLHRICTEPPRPIRDVNADVPDWLAFLIEKLLSKDPEDRFTSASQVADLMAHCLAHTQQPLSQPLPAELRRAKRTRRRGFLPEVGQRWLWAMASLAAVALAWIGGDRLSGRAAPEPLSATAQPAESRTAGDAGLVDWNSDPIDDSLGEIDRRLQFLEADELAQ